MPTVLISSLLLILLFFLLLLLLLLLLPWQSSEVLAIRESRLEYFPQKIVSLGNQISLSDDPF